MAVAEITLANGGLVTVEGALEDVEKRLSDAARSGQSRLAWFEEHQGGSVAINPSQVVTVRSSDSEG